MNAMRKCLLIAFVLLFCLIVSFKKVWGREWNPGIVGKLTILQGWEFALLLIRSVLFLSSSLKLKSNHEQFAQVVHCHNKRVNICKSHRLLLTKEQFAHVAHNKRVKNSKNSYFLSVFGLFLNCTFHLFKPKSESLSLLFANLLFFKEQPWANHSGHSEQNRNMSDSLWSLITKEQLRTICSHSSLKKSDRAIRWKKGENGNFTLSLTKTSDLLKKQMNAFPTLQFWQLELQPMLDS